MPQILKRIFGVVRRHFVRAKPHKNQASKFAKKGITNKKGHHKPGLETRSRKSQISFRRRFSPRPLLFVEPLLLVCQRSPRGFHAHEGQPRLLVFGPLGKEGAVLSIITKNIS
jgi:hypothetical protein